MVTPAKAPVERPQLLALDLDGTLVVPQKPVSGPVLAAVKRAAQAGVKVTIVTGRMYAGARHFVRDLEIAGPIICYQGAVIADAQTGKFLRELPLANAVALRVCAAAKANDFHVQLYAGDQFFVEERNRFADLYARISDVEPVVVPSLAQAFAGRDATKVNIVTDVERIPAALALMEATCGKDAYVTRSNPEFVEALNPAVDKGKALREIGAMLGIPMERVLGIGDSYNDIPFLQVAGFSVAMGSSPSELKTIADAVVADAEHDGVAEAIERFVF